MVATQRKLNCNPQKSHFCVGKLGRGSCIANSKACRYDLKGVESTIAAGTIGKKPALRPQPGDVLKQNITDLHFDPNRFQYKLAPGQGGATGSLSGVKRWDDNLAGVVQVWTDPADGKDYIVNGHNRANLAKNLGVEKVTVRYLDATDATEARAIGALTNIAEGRGNAMDAAKFFRDSGLSKSDLEERGIPMREKIATDGLALSALDDSLFQKVVNGDLPIARATIVGGSGLDKTQQRSLVDLIEKREKSGRKISNETLSELVDTVKSATTQTQTQIDLFGSSQVEQSLAIEKADLQSRVKQRLGREKKLFSTVAKSKAAQELAKAGNQINVEESGKVASDANTALAVFDQLKNFDGTISARLNQAAQEVANGGNRRTIESKLYNDILDLIKTQNY